MRASASGRCSALCNVAEGRIRRANWQVETHKPRLTMTDSPQCGHRANTAPSACSLLIRAPDVGPAPTDKIMVLSQHVLAQHSGWDVDLPASGSCSLNATDNVQGRLLNGIAADSVCGPDAMAYSGTFLHIEQDPNFRNPDDWIAAVVSNFP